MNTKSTRAFAPAAAVVLASLVAPGVADSAYEQIEVTDGGTITGRVTWQGARPEIAPLVINKNPKACDLDGTGKRASIRLQISGSGGVSNAVLYLEEIAKGKKVETNDLVIDQRGCGYTPHITIAPRKSKIMLKSSDDILHNIHMFGAANYNIPFPDKNSLEKSFRKSGVVRLQCDAGHGWMSSYVHVTDHPYYALTDADGNFKLTDVPAGTYTLKMWHEHWKITNTVEKDGQIVAYEYADPIESSQSVEVTAGSETKVSFSLSE